MLCSALSVQAEHTRPLVPQMSVCVTGVRLSSDLHADDTWSHTLEAPKTRVYHTALRSLSLGPFGKTLSTGWLQPGTELRYCVHIVSSCDHPEAWGYQPLWRLHGYPVTMLLESWNDFLHQEEPQQGSRPKLGQSSGVCLTVSTSVQPQKGFSISTRDWFY